MALNTHHSTSPEPSALPLCGSCGACRQGCRGWRNHCVIFSRVRGTEPGASPVLLLPRQHIFSSKRLFLALSGADPAPRIACPWELLVGSAGLQRGPGAAPDWPALLAGDCFRVSPQSCSPVSSCKPPRHPTREARSGKGSVARVWLWDDLGSEGVAAGCAESGAVCSTPVPWPGCLGTLLNRRVCGWGRRVRSLILPLTEE